MKRSQHRLPMTLNRNAYPSDLTDAQWELLDPLVPTGCATRRTSRVKWLQRADSCIQGFGVALLASHQKTAGEGGRVGGEAERLQAVPDEVQCHAVDGGRGRT
ncbi:MAG: hypothetical protein J2P36_17115 [Ktedonobacteraceae bacterium]|nr:hypothetical protein [Ktedonobacteraceae bacterium]